MNELELGEPKVWMVCPVCGHTAFVMLDEWRRCFGLPGFFMCPAAGCNKYMNWARVEVEGCLIVSDERSG